MLYRCYIVSFSFLSKASQKKKQRRTLLLKQEEPCSKNKRCCSSCFSKNPKNRCFLLFCCSRRTPEKRAFLRAAATCRSGVRFSKNPKNRCFLLFASRRKEPQEPLFLLFADSFETRRTTRTTASFSVVRFSKNGVFQKNPKNRSSLFVVIYIRGYIRKQQNSRNYSQSKAPFCHSYTKPIVKISKKTIIDQNPKNPILFKETAHGNKKVTSKSNMINKIETK